MIIAKEHNKEEIRRVLARIGEAWLNGRPDELNEYFHDDIVIKGPGFQELGRGKEVCVQSYKDFLNQTSIKSFKESEPYIDLWDDTAIATTPWEMVYVLENKEYKESGHDTFAFVYKNDRWQVVWRMIHFSPGSA